MANTDELTSPVETRRTTVEGMSIHHGRHTLQEPSIQGHVIQYQHFEVALDRDKVQDFLNQETLASGGHESKSGLASLTMINHDIAH